MPRYAVPLVLSAVLLAGCGGGAKTGGATEAPTSNCSGKTCTVMFPAKARNNQASAGGPGTTVFGTSAQLFSIAQGTATLRVGETSLSLEANKAQKAGNLSAKATSITDTGATVEFTQS